MEKQIPEFEAVEFFEKRNKYCLLIPLFNEGERLSVTPVPTTVRRHMNF